MKVDSTCPEMRRFYKRIEQGPTDPQGDEAWVRSHLVRCKRCRKMNLDPNCPEANGFFCALEEHSAEIPHETAAAMAETWVQEHLTECRQCQAANKKTDASVARTVPA